MRISLLLLLLLSTLDLAAQIPAGPLLWLTADSGIVIAGGGVARWNDHSGNGYAAWQDTAALRPTLVTDPISGQPTLHFSGDGDFMEATSVFPVASDYTLLFVVKLNDLAATNNVLSGNSHAHWFGGNGYAKVLHGNFTTQAIASIPVVQSEFTIVAMSYREAGTRAAIHINGIFADSAAVGANADPTIYLGAFQKANVLNGDLAEVILFDRELSESDREQSEEYLFDRYEIARPPAPLPPDTTFSRIPAQLQFLARDDRDSATLRIAGTLRVPGFDSIHVRITRNGQPWKRLALPLDYTGGAAPFDFSPSIHAELSEYGIMVGLKSATRDSTIATRDSIVCGDAYLINGQSNSIFGNGSPTTHEFARTFGNDFSPSPRDTLWTLARSSGFGDGPDIGAWGMRLASLLIDHTGVPVCIINGGVGGTSIEQHQRIDTNPVDRTTIYGSMLYRVRKAGLAAEARAMLWYQGESNTIDGYYENFKALYSDWRSDYPALEKIYVVQIRPGCAAGDHLALRELLRTLPDSLADIVAYSPMGVPGHDGCHYTAEGYDTIGTQIFRLVARDLHGSADTVDIGSPDIRKAFYTNDSMTTIALVFDNARNGLAISPDTLVGQMRPTIGNAFFLDDVMSYVSSARVSADTLYLRLSRPYTATTITYIPSTYYPASQVIYEGPWIKNLRGLGAFSFHRFPITEADPASSVDNETSAGDADLAAVPNPATGATGLIVTLPRPGSVTIALYDASGALIGRQVIEGDAGRNVLRIDTGELPTGLYHCTMSTADGRRSIQLVVMR